MDAATVAKDRADESNCALRNQRTHSLIHTYTHVTHTSESSRRHHRILINTPQAIN